MFLIYASIWPVIQGPKLLTSIFIVYFDSTFLGKCLLTTLFTIHSTVKKDFFKKRLNYLFSIKCDETFFSHIKGKKKKAQVSTPNKNETVVAKEQLCWPREESLRKCLGKYFDLSWTCPSWFAWEASPFTWSEDSGNFSPLLGGPDSLEVGSVCWEMRNES